MQMADGGQMAFSEYGDASGRPVLFCHGWPARSMASTHAAAQKLGVRIISPDRLASGLVIRGRAKLLDWPAAATRLAHLGIPRVRMLAISGGAPYAYATAWACRSG
jgi:pimeloyl-ACP methyl ester carboxylesterase